MYPLACSEGTRNSSLKEAVYFTSKHYEKLFTSVSGVLNLLKKVMAFVLLYLQGKMPEEKRKNALFRQEC